MMFAGSFLMSGYWLLLGAVRSVAVLLLVSSYDVCGQLSHVRIFWFFVVPY